MTPNVPWESEMVLRLRECECIEDARRQLPELSWKKCDVDAGDGCVMADLSTDWQVLVVESASLIAHRHGKSLPNGDPAPVGEMVAVLVGSVEDVDADGGLVTLQEGQVLVHDPDSIHQPNIPLFCIFLVHRPAGLLPLFAFDKQTAVG